MLGASSTPKRKRSYSQRSPSFTTNPLSYSQSIISQFSIAGLSETDVLPSSYVRDFPHRPLQREVSLGRGNQHTEPELSREGFGSENENEIISGLESGDSKQRKSKKIKKESNEDVEVTNTVNTLLQSVHHFLSSGRIENASRAFGLLISMKPKGTPVDIRQKFLWATGAEILMRRGEEDKTSAANNDGDREDAETAERGSRDTAKVRTRWGQARNMPRVRAYYESLIQRYPWDHRFPNTTSALDFWPALMSCEIYNVNMEHVLHLEQLNSSASRSSSSSSSPASSLPDQHFEKDDDDDDDDEIEFLRKKDKLRMKAQDSMEKISSQMDDLMQAIPFSKCTPLLKLRAAAAMYMSDLVLPVAGRGEHQEAFRRRKTEKEMARQCLRNVMELGGSLNKMEWEILVPESTALETGADSSNVSYSLPIRSPNERTSKIIT